MHYLKKTVIFALLSGLMIGNTQANMDDDIEDFLTRHNWHRVTVWNTKMRTQDLFLDGPLSILAIGLGVGCLRLPFIKDYSIPRSIGKSFNHPFEDVIMGCMALTIGAAGLASIYYNTLKVQTENQ